ncbi:Hypothetical predicted protein [Mytilus galloprovincialis]|uniref:EGF-like domain-containing protein n=1 Tax=Mytilus galloprovincialis TaxID=29158 RepID=A0A8B6H0N2_MYTGA|nr:Hypothetical predicted protein [Mytilus galloprovincialis]
MDEINGYSCTCQKGFTGRLCETNINECASNPCKHNSSCKDRTNDYQCSCQSGYMGKNCDILITTLAPSTTKRSILRNLLRLQQQNVYYSLLQQQNLLLRLQQRNITTRLQQQNILVYNNELTSPYNYEISYSVYNRGNNYYSVYNNEICNTPSTTMKTVYYSVYNKEIYYSFYNTEIYYSVYSNEAYESLYNN